MPESQGTDPGASRDRRSQDDRNRAGQSDLTAQSFRERIRRDPFLFALCLGFMAFTTWSLAVSWRLLNEPVLLALTVSTIPPAFYLFYLRDGPAPKTPAS
jgi:hypothetical protein